MYLKIKFKLTMILVWKSDFYGYEKTYIWHIYRVSRKY